MKVLIFNLQGGEGKATLLYILSGTLGDFGQLGAMDFRDVCYRPAFSRIWETSKAESGRCPVEAMMRH